MPPMVGKLRTTSMVGTILGAIGSLMPGFARAQPNYGPYADGPWGMHGMWGMGVALLMLVFWVVVIAALVYGIRWLATQGRNPHRETPLDVAKRRYASGEITREQFEALKRDLS